MRGIRSYTATYSITSTSVGNLPSSSNPSLTGMVAWQNRPVVLADEKSYTNDPAVSMRGGVETVIDDHVIYIRISALSTIFGKPWIKIDAASLSTAAGAMAPIVQSLAPNLLAYAQLFAPSTNVHKVGTQVINGVRTTEYAGTTTIAAGLSHLSPSMRELIAPLLSSMKATTAHFTVWIDDQHIIRKEVATQQVPGGKAAVTVVVTSINQPVAVRLPPASQVATVPGL
jgi:hypothetical protein